MGSNEITSGDSVAPELFPLPAQDTWAFGGQLDKLAFGWAQHTVSQPARFYLSKRSTFGGWSEVEHWPLTDEGWQAAVTFMRSESPELWERVEKACEIHAKRLAATDRGGQSEEFRKKREAEGGVAVLVGCVLLGGYGFEDGIEPGAKVDIHFTRQGVWVTRANGAVPYLRRSYEATRALDFEGGLKRSGGGYRGGGFGVLGAAEGMAMAGLLNSLTARTEIHTTVRLEATDAEVFFFTDQATPRSLSSSVRRFVS